tara:strand:+ start:810 stop:1061 length:252 start_codon:yes stop_codon:yes gene_type:complete
VLTDLSAHDITGDNLLGKPTMNNKSKINPISKDLYTSKYTQRVVGSKKKPKQLEFDWESEWGDATSEQDTRRNQSIQSESKDD